MRLLITGFEPFGGSSLNPSEQIAKTLDGQTINDGLLVSAILPVDYQSGPQKLLETIQNCQPDAVLCLGQSSGEAAITIERVAINLLDYRIPDNAGRKIVDAPIISGGPAAYFVTLPVREIHQALSEACLPARLSLSAGSYLCNQVLYHLLHYINIQGLNIPAGFIHLPSLPEQASGQPRPQPSMSLETSLAGIRTAIAVIASSC